MSHGPVREGVKTPMLRKSRAVPRPRRRKGRSKAAGQKAKTKAKAAAKAMEMAEVEVEREEPVELPEGHRSSEGLTTLYRIKGDDGSCRLESTEVVKRAANLGFRPLPVPQGVTAPMAAGAFDVDTFVSGMVLLAPGTSKKLECVRGCTQVFFVAKGQAKSVEFQAGEPNTTNAAVAAKMLPFLLSEGDHFYVHPYNSYSLRNFSKTTPAHIHFVVIKPPPKIR